MARNIIKHKGRRDIGTFLALPHDVINSENFSCLSGNAVKLLVQIAAQYNGKNNGDLTLAWSCMKTRGWKSPATLNRARKILIDYGMIVMTRQGGLGKASLYAITWQSVNECQGKHEHPVTQVAPGTWKEPPDPARVTRVSCVSQSSKLPVALH